MISYKQNVSLLLKHTHTLYINTHTHTHYIYIYIYIKTHCYEIEDYLVNFNGQVIWLIGLVGRVFANGPGDRGSVPGRVISKTLKIVLDTSLPNTQHYKVRIMGKVEQSKERSSAFPYTSV